MVGTQVGPYEIVREIGAGGMGAVYEALHVQLGRKVALKVLKPEIASSTDMLTRFFNEARAVNHVDHPGLVQISDFGSLPNGSPYLVMELLRGHTLAERLKARTRLSESEALAIIEQLASILAAAHDKGIVHRDVKPSNIMLVPDPAMPGGERVKLLDFGIAKIANSTIASGGLPTTQAGLPLGTPLYMSPEQCVGKTAVDGKADVYALGVILFELLAGQPPFEAENQLALLNMHVSKAPPPLPPGGSTVTTATRQLLSRLLSKDKDLRPTAAQLQVACHSPGTSPLPLSLANARPVLALPLEASKLRLVSGVVALALVLTCALLWWRQRPAPLRQDSDQHGIKPTNMPQVLAPVVTISSPVDAGPTPHDGMAVASDPSTLMHKQPKQSVPAASAPGSPNKLHPGKNSPRVQVPPSDVGKNKKSEHGKKDERFYAD